MIVNRGLETEMGSPKYARLELERRWLADKAVRPYIDELNFTLIEDRYIDSTRIRLRRMTRRSQTVHKLTKKYETQRPEARPVVTAYLTEAEHALFSSLPALVLRKRRFPLTFEDRIWSLDVFEGPLEGLELVEIEAADEAELSALVPPSWATKEVTNDPRYQCGSLAQTLTIPE